MYTSLISEYPTTHLKEFDYKMVTTKLLESKVSISESKLIFRSNQCNKKNVYAVISICSLQKHLAEKYAFIHIKEPAGLDIKYFRLKCSIII